LVVVDKFPVNNIECKGNSGQNRFRVVSQLNDVALQETTKRVFG